MFLYEEGGQHVQDREGGHRKHEQRYTEREVSSEVNTAAEILLQ